MKVDLIKHWGSDLDVANAARVSFDKQHEHLDDKDERLISYLASHKHWSPFAHVGATFRVEAPVFVARQLHKHQVGFDVNELSRRYVKNPPTFWRPQQWREVVSNKKQGSGAALSKTKTRAATLSYNTSIKATSSAYKHLLDLGVCEEQARSVLPVAHNTTWIWSGSLCGWARVCNLRLSPDAQPECANVVDPIDQHMSTLFPVSWRNLYENPSS